MFMFFTSLYNWIRMYYQFRDVERDGKIQLPALFLINYLQTLIANGKFCILISWKIYSLTTINL